MLKKMISTLEEETTYLQHKRCIHLAAELGFMAHQHQVRKSGQPFFTHPFEVARILASQKMDSYSIIAGLLHDTVEDTDISFDDIELLFTKRVRNLVEGMTKVSKLSNNRQRLIAKEEVDAENMRSLFIAMSNDWRVIIIKLADRLHNMRTIDGLPLHKQLVLAKETNDIFVPIAHRLGLRFFKTELGDLSLKCMDKAAHDQIAKYVEKKVSNGHFVLEYVVEQLREKLTDLCVEHTISYRSKSIHSIHEKMCKFNVKVQDILDILALRVVVNASEPVCYSILDMVNDIWPHQCIKDYIAHPKENGYQSLHSTIEVFDQFVEVQIRTTTMHVVAEQGTAAHWLYKEKHPVSWHLASPEISAAENAADFVMKVKDQFKSCIFVFTDEGVLMFVKGSVVLDVTNTMAKPSWNYDVYVNGHKQNDMYVLNNGDRLSLHPSSIYGEKYICEECLPVLGDSVVEVDNILHRKECSRYMTNIDLSAELIYASSNKFFESHIFIICIDRAGLLLEITNIVTSFVDSIIDVKSTNENTISTFYFRLSVQHVIQIRRIFAKLNEVDGVLSVHRDHM